MSEQKHDIETLSDIKILVDSFYSQIRKDDLLADIFNTIIQDRWPQHLEKMYRFWQTILLEEHTYIGSPFLPHAKLPVNQTHFNRWLTLFYETVDSLFEGEKASRAKWQSERMAKMFLNKIEYYKTKPAIPLL